MTHRQKQQPQNFEAVREHVEDMFRIVLEEVDDVVAVFDTDLTYILANKAACKLLQKEEHELVGKNLLELFPQLTASNSHRCLLQALSGQQVNDARSEGTFTREGAKYVSCYYPLKKNGVVQAVLAITKKLYFPAAGA